jgi:hypothetical protein
MERSERQRLREEDIETVPPEPGLTAPLDHVREEEEDSGPAPAMAGAEMPGSTEAVDGDTRDEPSMESSGTVDAKDATDSADKPGAGDDAGDDSGDGADGTDAGDDTGDDADGTDAGDDAGDSDDADSTDPKDDAGSDDSDSEDSKHDAGSDDAGSKRPGA